VKYQILSQEEQEKYNIKEAEKQGRT